MKLLLAFLFSVNAFAGAGTFPQGDSVKMLRDKLKFKTGRTMESTDVDPTAIATPGDRGSILVNNTGVFHKNDDGTTTNWTLISGSGIPLLAKGSLLTSDGTSNGEFTACANGEIIEWDSTETNGFKCVTKPTSLQTFIAFSNGTAGPDGSECDLVTFNPLAAPCFVNYFTNTSAGVVQFTESGTPRFELTIPNGTFANSSQISCSGRCWNSAIPSNSNLHIFANKLVVNASGGLSNVEFDCLRADTGVAPTPQYGFEFVCRGLEP